MIHELAMNHARQIYRQMVSFRQWNEERGGVYALVDDVTVPNPYIRLPDRDLLTRDGRKLTLVNTAYMTRQVSELCTEDSEPVVRLTSLNPLRPGNGPKTWEASALKTFEEGKTFYADLRPDSRGVFRYHYMEPLMVEPSCLGCHAFQGEGLGDVRGGISVSFPVGSLMGTSFQSRTFNLATFVIFWLMGLVLITALVLGIEHQVAGVQASRGESNRR